jgi:hypothetical protein
MSTFGALVGGGTTYLLPASVSSLSESTMQELRSALTTQLKHPDGPVPEVTALLRKIAREAQSSGVRPEQLLVAFKETWNSVADSMRPRSPEQYERIRENLVTLCIQAYYAD